MSWKVSGSNARRDMQAIRRAADFNREHAENFRQGLAQVEADKTQLVKAVALLDRTIQVVSANGIGKIESIVTGGLQLVFGERNIGLRIEKKETKRGNSYELVPYRGNVKGPALDTFGGSLSNVVAFLLRVIMIHRFGLARVLFVDESFNGVSSEYQPMVSAMLKALCDNHGFTVLAITHQPIMAAAADNVYRLQPGVEEGAPPTLIHLGASERELLQMWAERMATELTDGIAA